MLIRLVTVVACSLVVAVVVVGAGAARPGSVATVGCGDIVDHGLPPGYREPLATLAVPAAFLPNVGSDPSAAPFTFWTKAGIVIRANNVLTVAVAPKAANRVHITWGGATGTVIRFPACHTGAKWNAFAGGFLTRTATSCVPLIVRAGRRHAIVTFGLGRRCSK